MLKLAFCGNDCNICERYIATRSGDAVQAVQLEEVAVLWKRLGYRDSIEPPEKMACYGCSSALWCRFGIKECSLQSKAANCGRCGEYPCGKIETMFHWNLMHAERMKDKCSKKDYDRLLNVPDTKKQNLDKEHRIYLLEKDLLK